MEWGKKEADKKDRKKKINWQKKAKIRQIKSKI
jgi:hypothetical protein